ncbi:MAG: leucine--tRNA ligase, partial [Lachnospiraceae bacterium]|nr:leucine--tRNA ligase [Lachnospiraceae bacterium]
EIWHGLGNEGFIALAKWPEYDEAKTVEDTVEVGVQVNGKLKNTVAIPFNGEKDEVLAIAKADEKVAASIEGKTLVKEIYVPNKIINFVVK